MLQVMEQEIKEMDQRLVVEHRDQEILVDQVVMKKVLQINLEQKEVVLQAQGQIETQG